jgi:UDP-N-acetylmuramoyl-L-alanyl-D-glutamate--2,6-diaminopimelate ligase
VVRLRDLHARLERQPRTEARPVAVGGDLDVEVTAVTHDSRRVEPGTVFCCVRGRDHDGHDHAAEALAAGAVALLVDRPVAVPAPFIQVTDVRRAMGPVSSAVYGDPSRHVDVVGITGTNGKTTTAAMVAAVLAAGGRRPAVLGTLSGVRTTPEAPELAAWLAQQRRSGVDAVVMEVSSHGIALGRIDGMRFRVGVFTNLSQDHLDFHGTMEAYFRAKAALFSPEHLDQAVINRDDPWGRRLLADARVPVTAYGLDDASDVAVGADRLDFRWRGRDVEVPIGGRFNLANALAAATAGAAMGLDPDTVARGLAQLSPVPGRFESLDEGQRFAVLVDYAHTPDALENLLVSAAEIAAGGRIHLVFGCGGERDQTKREPMGEVAARRADRVVLTADNSRGEDTGAIIGAIRRGHDRAAALPGGRRISSPNLIGPRPSPSPSGVPTRVTSS